MYIKFLQRFEPSVFVYITPDPVTYWRIQFYNYLSVKGNAQLSSGVFSVLTKIRIPAEWTHTPICTLDQSN